MCHASPSTLMTSRDLEMTADACPPPPVRRILKLSPPTISRVWLTLEELAQGLTHSIYDDALQRCSSLTLAARQEKHHVTRANLR